jgi:hypothetical protein
MLDKLPGEPPAATSIILLISLRRIRIQEELFFIGDQYKLPEG